MSVTSATSRPSTPRSLDAVQNIAIVAVLWIFYSSVRSIGAAEAVAFENASKVLEFQDLLGLNIEGSLQSAFSWTPIIKAFNAYYLVHFPVTVGLLVWTYLKRRNDLFLRYRNALIVTNVIGLVGHLAFPLAPPRMLDGFIDYGETIGPNPYDLPGSEAANEFAAMPSLHVAWAILVGVALWKMIGRVFKLVAVLHPIITSLVVVATANHYVIDVLLGAVLAFIAYLAASFATDWFKRRTSAPDDVQLASPS